jgi:ADP-ribose pyrophosphatase
MQEEAGFLPRKLVKLGGFYSAPGFCTEYLHLYLATDLTKSQLFAEDTEGISLERVPMKEIPALLASGKIEDAKSIAGLYMFLEYRKRH